MTLFEIVWRIILIIITTCRKRGKSYTFIMWKMCNLIARNFRKTWSIHSFIHSLHVWIVVFDYFIYIFLSRTWNAHALGSFVSSVLGTLCPLAMFMFCACLVVIHVTFSFLTFQKEFFFFYSCARRRERMVSIAGHVLFPYDVYVAPVCLCLLHCLLTLLFVNS